MDRKQRQKLRQALLRELDLLEYEGVGAKKEKSAKIDSRKLEIGKQLIELVNEREMVSEDKKTPWGRQQETCKKNGISKYIFQKRIDEGMSEIEAATKPKEVAYSPFSKNQLSIMKKNGICYKTAYKRVMDLKWSAKDAVAYKPGEKPRNPDITNATSYMRKQQAGNYRARKNVRDKRKGGKK